MAKWTPKDTLDLILEVAITTQLTQEEIARMFGVTRKVVHRVLANNLTIESRLAIKKANYSKSKLGESNPMYGKVVELHHNYKGDCMDGKGYIIVLKPSWYTGRAHSKHIFKHHVVICEHLGLTELPAGYEVHHLDKNPLNNDIENLLLVTKEEHAKLHNVLRKEQRLSERSRA